MSHRYPPGPRNWHAGIGLVPQIRRDILGFYSDLRDRYGDIVYTRIGPYRDYVVFHPDLIKEVLVTKAKFFHKMPWQVRIFRQWNGDSVLLTEGDVWLRQRRLVQPAFHPRRFAGYGQAMVACTERMLDGWNKSGQREIEVVQAMTDLTINVIAKTMFDLDVGDKARGIGEAVAVLNDVAMYEMMSPIHLPGWLPTPYQRRKRNAIEHLNQTIRSLIRERRASGEDHGDLLSMLLLAKDDEGDGSGLTDEQVRNEVMTLLLAGHDTTAAGLSWLLYAIASQAEVKWQVLEELDEVLEGRAPTASDVPRLKFLERVIKETLRKYPPAIGTFGRQAVADVEVGGYVIRKGSVMRTLSYPVHHDPRWFPEPETFDPDRFAPGRVERIPQYAYFPFGCGPRVCVGNTFAMMEMTLIAATLLRRCQMELAPGQGEPHLSVQLSLRPAGGLRMRMTPRAHEVLAGVGP